MAGYDYTYCVKKQRRNDTRFFLMYIKRVYNRYEIYSYFRTKIVGDITEVYIYVDGKMAMLQLAERNMIEEISHFINVMDKNGSYRREVIIPFIDGCRKGICNITNMVYDLQNSFNGYGVEVLMASKILSVRLIDELDDKESIVSKFISIVDTWFHGSLSNTQCILLIDQFIEETNKHLLGEVKSKRGYAEVLDDIYSKGLIKNTTANDLKKIHRLRNKAQHRGVAPSNGDINYVVDTGFIYLNLLDFRQGS